MTRSAPVRRAAIEAARQPIRQLDLAKRIGTSPRMIRFLVASGCLLAERRGGACYVVASPEALARHEADDGLEVAARVLLALSDGPATTVEICERAGCSSGAAHRALRPYARRSAKRKLRGGYTWWTP